MIDAGDADAREPYTSDAGGGGGETHTIGQFYTGIGGGKSATSQS